MVIFLYGSDSYRLKQARDNLINRYKSKYQSGVDLFRFDFSDSDTVDDLRASLRTESFFDEHKLVVCKEIFAKKNIAEEISEWLKDRDLESFEGITVVLSENNSEKDLKFKNGGLFKILNEKSGLIESFEPLVNDQLRGWVRAEFLARECSVDDSVVDRLIEITGNESWALINEITKLASFGNEKIETSDVDKLVAKKIDLKIFDLIDAIAEKNRDKAVTILFRELKNGQDPYYILSMINYQLRNLAIVGDLLNRNFTQPEIIKKTGLHPFVIKKTARIYGGYPMDNIKSDYVRLLNMDLGAKRGLINIVDHLYGFIGA